MTPEQRTALAAELAKPAYAGLELAEITAALCAEPMISNPTPQGKKPAPISFEALLGELEANSGSAARLSQMPSLPKFVDDVRNGDIPAAKNWLLLAVGCGIVTQGEYAAMLALLSAEVDDDTWPAEVPGPSILEQITGMRGITGREIEEVLNG